MFKSSQLRAEILELFEDLNQAEEREIDAHQRVKTFKHSLKPSGKFGKVKPVFFKPTVRESQLRAIHADLITVQLRKCGRTANERRKLKKYRSV